MRSMSKEEADRMANRFRRAKQGQDPIAEELQSMGRGQQGANHQRELQGNLNQAQGGDGRRQELAQFLKNQRGSRMASPPPEGRPQVPEQRDQRSRMASPPPEGRPQVPEQRDQLQHQIQRAQERAQPEGQQAHADIVGQLRGRLESQGGDPRRELQGNMNQAQDRAQHGQAQEQMRTIAPGEPLTNEDQQVIVERLPGLLEELAKKGIPQNELRILLQDLKEYLEGSAEVSGVR